MRFVLCQELDSLIRLLDITDTSPGAPYSLPRVTQEPSAKKGVEEDRTSSEAERETRKRHAQGKREGKMTADEQAWR